MTGVACSPRRLSEGATSLAWRSVGRIDVAERRELVQRVLEVGGRGRQAAGCVAERLSGVLEVDEEGTERGQAPGGGCQRRTELVVAGSECPGGALGGIHEAAEVVGLLDGTGQEPVAVTDQPGQGDVVGHDLIEKVGHGAQRRRKLLEKLVEVGVATGQPDPRLVDEDGQACPGRGVEHVEHLVQVGGRRDPAGRDRDHLALVRSRCARVQVDVLLTKQVQRLDRDRRVLAHARRVVTDAQHQLDVVVGRQPELPDLPNRNTTDPYLRIVAKPERAVEHQSNAGLVASATRDQEHRRHDRHKGDGAGRYRAGAHREPFPFEGSSVTLKSMSFLDIGSIA